MIEELAAGGNYAYASSLLKDENFPGDGGDGQVTYMRRTGSGVTRGQAVSWMGEEGMRPATVGELLRFAASSPGEPSESYYVVALGSACFRHDGGSCVPVLSRGSSGRRLSVDWHRDDYEWGGPHCVFAAVPSTVEALT